MNQHIGRSGFLVGSSALLLAGCSGSTLSRALSPHQLSLADTVASVGIVSATDRTTGRVFYANVPPDSKSEVAQDCSVPVFAGRARRVTDQCDPDIPPPWDGAIQVALPVIGSTGVIFCGPSAFAFNASIPVGATVYGALQGGYNGPLYQLASFKYWKCAAAATGAASAARTMALYIVQNSAKYSAAIAGAAKNALSEWGGAADMGVAAAAEFLFGIAAALTVGDWVFLLSACGIAAAAIYLAIVCISDGLAA